ncbi:hypothetical protein KFK09_021145 [Dendrobium nobile]|uniref:Uncharacterized protein n=1 Tax=Dendrobium nobile TaxID=94219 RepID=A0A8T3ANY9_DENNO|nr:hypothetical protein KFK09_021145 [Dendrobium nobile]
MNCSSSYLTATRAACRSIGLFQQAIGGLKASASRALNTVSEVEANKPKRRKKKNLFDVAHFLPNWGIGYKMCKSSWRDLSYEITKINLYKDGRHGKAWGVRYKAGLPVSDVPVKISGVNKGGWKYLKDSKKKEENSPEAKQPIQS